MVDYKDLGKRVRTLRRTKNMTQEQLAEMLGISASFMGHIERGSRIASLDTLVTLCNVLKVSPHHLLSASLEDEVAEHMPTSLTTEQRGKLSAFLRMAQDTIDGWKE